MGLEGFGPCSRDRFPLFRYLEVSSCLFQKRHWSETWAEPTGAPTGNGLHGAPDAMALHLTKGRKIR